MALTARASASQNDIVIEAPLQSGGGSILQLRLTLAKSRKLRLMLAEAEKEIENRIALDYNSLY